jgi:hypothetical protein
MGKRLINQRHAREQAACRLSDTHRTILDAKELHLVLQWVERRLGKRSFDEGSVQNYTILPGTLDATPHKTNPANTCAFQRNSSLFLKAL